MKKANVEMVIKVLEAVEAGDTSSHQVAEKVGVHFSTVTRHLRALGLPTVVAMSSYSPEEIQRLKDKVLSNGHRDPAPFKPKAKSRKVEIPTADKRPGYATRKEFGSRQVVCRICRKRGVANIRLVGRRGSVVCADCRREGRA